MHFSIKQARTLFEECFWQTLCLNIGYCNVLSPTGVLLLDASLLAYWVFGIVIEFRRAWRRSMFSKFFAVCYRLWKKGCFRFEQIETIFALLDGSYLLRIAIGNKVSDSIESSVVVPVNWLLSCSLCYNKDSLLRLDVVLLPHGLLKSLNGLSLGFYVGRVFETYELSELIHR